MEAVCQTVYERGGLSGTHDKWLRQSRLLIGCFYILFLAMWLNDNPLLPLPAPHPEVLKCMLPRYVNPYELNHVMLFSFFGTKIVLERNIGEGLLRDKK